MACYIVKTQKIINMISVTGKKPRVRQNSFDTSLKNRSSLYSRLYMN